MSTTTQILFNSPALHSLKRDQLVRLCKIHAIKASGKSVDLVERLKQHAATLPNDDPLHVAVHGGEEVENEVDDSRRMPRPSEQWEVMESIEELEESSSQGTLNSMRMVSQNGASEFGTSKSSNTVSSSIKALATSLGLKRLATSSSKPMNSADTSPDELAQHAVPYSDLPASDPDALPQSDNFTFAPPDPMLSAEAYSTDDTAPIPGHALRPGRPAPADARLSLGLSTPNKAATTTIRLITAAAGSPASATPQLQRFETAFDLVMSPASAPPVWPQRAPGSLYPSLAAMDVGGSAPAASAAEDEDVSMEMPGALSFTVPRATPGKAATSRTPGKQLPDDTPDDIFSPAKPAQKLPDDTPNDIFSPAKRKLPDDTSNDIFTPAKPSKLPDNTPQDIFSPVRPAVAPAPQPQASASTLRAPVEPFIFGSPLPQHRLSNVQFQSAAAAVLAEMNARLAGEGVPGVGMDLLLNKGTRPIAPLPAERGRPADRFESVHAKEFDKMESIAGWVRKRSPEKERAGAAVGGKRKSSVLGEERRRLVPVAPGKRRPSGGVRPAARVISNSRRNIPGAFGEAEEEGDPDENRRMSKRPRVEVAAVSSEGSVKEKGKEEVKDPQFDDVGSKEEEQQRIQRERDAIRRKLEQNKARRRSSMAAGGRVSIGRGAPKAKASTSRFGFLSSAKSLVQNVWNRNKTTAAPPSKVPAPSSIPVTKPTMGPPPVPTAKKASLSSSRPSSISSNRASTRIPSVSSSSKLLGVQDKSTVTSSSSSARSRSPIPAFPQSTAGSRSSKGGSSIGLSAAASRASGSRIGGISRNGSLAGASSIGTHVGGSASGSRVSSLGTRGSLASDAGSSSKKQPGSVSSKRLSSTSTSRLLAPTASSLAKTHTTGTARSSMSQEQGKMPAITESAAKSALEQITNSPGPSSRLPTPRTRPGGIFSSPLANPGPSGIPVPSPLRAAHSSLGAAAATLAKPPIPPKPKTLPGRRPRISRSKVIAKLASQRVASGATAPAGSTPGRAGPAAGRTRSSLGAKRQSYGGGKVGRASAGMGGVLLSAKKRARQSEYVRRRSRISALGADAGGGMDIDE